MPKHKIPSEVKDLIDTLQKATAHFKEDKAITTEQELKYFNQASGIKDYETNKEAYSENASRILDFFINHGFSIVEGIVSQHDDGITGTIGATAAITGRMRQFINSAAYYLDYQSCVPHITSDKLYEKMLWVEWILTKLDNYRKGPGRLGKVADTALKVAIEKRLPATKRRLDDYAKTHKKTRMSIEDLEKEFKTKIQTTVAPVSIAGEQKTSTAMPEQEKVKPLPIIETAKAKECRGIISDDALSEAKEDRLTAAQQEKERAEREAREQAETERLVREKEEAERLAKEKAETEREAKKAAEPAQSEKQPEYVFVNVARPLLAKPENQSAGSASTVKRTPVPSKPSAKQKNWGGYVGGFSIPHIVTIFLCLAFPALALPIYGIGLAISMVSMFLCRNLECFAIYKEIKPTAPEVKKQSSTAAARSQLNIIASPDAHNANNVTAVRVADDKAAAFVKSPQVTQADPTSASEHLKLSVSPLKR